MQMYSNNLGIETDCTAGMPTYNPNLDAQPATFIQ